MKLKQLFFAFFILLHVAGHAQATKKEVLFTIDGKPYYTDEFSRVYKKNLELVKDESQKDLDQYLDLFIGYKLKINKAYKLGLQNGTQYQNELKSYRTQLSKNYVTDSKVTKELVEEGYSRLQKEVNASHILLMLDENASPEDTLKTYRQAMDIRQKALAGEDFGKLAQQYSQDPSAKENQGNLGFFTAFRMVYAFENAAFNTAKGEISKPVRTRFGYHLIKVNDVRQNRGEVTVAHIMVLKPQTDDAAAKEKAEKTIRDIYSKLKQGEDFAALAKQFSEDKSSSSKGGQLNRFGSGQLSSEEFENVAFTLKSENEISEPFQSQFGWHIVKLIQKHPVRKLDEMQAELESKVAKDDRSRLITASLNEKLRKKYKIKRDAKMYSAIQKAVDNKFYEGGWVIPENKKPFAGTLVDINGKKIQALDFLAYLQSQQKAGLTTRPINKLVDQVYEKFLDQQLNLYFNDNLEQEFPEFSAVMDEYRDGLLLFELMEKEIWQKSKNDTIGLRAFFDGNASKYQWKKRFDITIASSTKEDVIKSAQKMLKQGKTPDQIKEKLNLKETVNVMTTSGVFEEGHDSLPKNLPNDTGVTPIVKDGQYFFVSKINKILPAGQKTLEESKGKAINDYQQFLEDNWVKELKKEFSVNVDRSVFENIKKELRP